MHGIFKTLHQAAISIIVIIATTATVTTILKPPLPVHCTSPATCGTSPSTCAASPSGEHSYLSAIETLPDLILLLSLHNLQHLQLSSKFLKCFPSTITATNKLLSKFINRTHCTLLTCLYQLLQ